MDQFLQSEFIMTHITYIAKFEFPVFPPLIFPEAGNETVGYPGGGTISRGSPFEYGLLL